MNKLLIVFIVLGLLGTVYSACTDHADSTACDADATCLWSTAGAGPCGYPPLDDDAALLKNFELETIDLK
jgi:hypothetical protein